MPGWPATRTIKPGAPDCAWPAPDNSAMGLANRYHLTVSPGAYDMGSFQKITTDEKSVTLVRAESADTARVQQWAQANGANGAGPAVVMSLTLSDNTGQPVVTHVYSGARVSKWSIGAMDAGASPISIETLVFSYAGETCT